MSDPRIASTSSEFLRATLKADSDPTGETVEWNFVSGTDVADPAVDDSGWTAGTWESWTAATGKAVTLSPLVGSTSASPAATVSLAATSRVWVRVTTGTEAPVLDFGIVEVY